MNITHEFEDEFKKFTRTKHAIACCNGTAALHTSLLCLNVGLGDKVITSPFSFVASSNCILYCGGQPIFADIKLNDYCIDPKQVRQKLAENPDVKGIICVHLFGNVCDLDALRDICDTHDLWLVEDCAQALGAKYKGQHVGNIGEFGIFSTYTSKNLWTFEGGILITKNVELAEKARMIINHGRVDKHTHKILGYNYRMPEICALLGLRMLQLHKKAILSELGSYGPAEGYYPYVIYNQPLYQKLGITGNCPNAEKIAEKVRKGQKI